MADLTGKTALVTGASSGIGKAIALALARAGVATGLVGRKQPALDDAAELAKQHASGSRGYRVELTHDGELEALASGLERDLGGLDILVHCAGTIHQGKLAGAPVADLDAQYRANVRVPYLLTQKLLPLLRARQGQIVFINSTVGLQARATVSQFAATQHALKALADALREEIEPEGVRVITIFPGRTATPRQEGIYRLEGRTYKPEMLMQPEDIAAAVLTALTLPRTAAVTEIRMRPLVKSY